MINLFAQAECNTQSVNDIVSLLDYITKTLAPYYPVGWAIIIVRKILT